MTRKRIDLMLAVIGALVGVCAPRQASAGSSFAPAYVGQPAPGSIYWGAAISGNGDPYVRHEQYVGVPLSIRRTYYQWDDRTSSYLTSRLEDDRLNNRLSWISFKTPTWSQMASGVYDSQIDQMLNTLRDSDGTIWLTIWHEPENDLSVGTPAEHAAMNLRVRQRVDALGISNVALAANLMAWTWNPSSGRNPDSWWAPDIYDLLGVDIYSNGGTLLKNEWYDLREWAAGKGVDVAVAEWGIDGTSATHVWPWYEHAIASHQDGAGARVVALSNFDSNLNGGHELAGEQLQAFRDLMLDPRTARLATTTAVIAAYDANAQTPAPNPISAAGGSWTAGGLNPAGVSELAGNEFGRNYWELNDNNAGGVANSSRNYTFGLITADVNHPEGWTATAVVKVLSASNTPSGVTFEVRGGGKMANLSFVHDGTIELVGQSLGGNTAIVALESLDLDTYNTFQMWYDPTDQLVDVYVNGHFASTITPGSSNLSRVLWGSNTSSATGVARWQEVRFETGFAIVAPLPGDFNGDGRVDAGDYIVWRKNDGGPISYQEWRTNFGRSLLGGEGGSSASSPAAPEPTAGSVAVLLAVAGGLRWRAPRASSQPQRE